MITYTIVGAGIALLGILVGAAITNMGSTKKGED